MLYKLQTANYTNKHTSIAKKVVAVVGVSMKKCPIFRELFPSNGVIEFRVHPTILESPTFTPCQTERNKVVKHIPPEPTTSSNCQSK